MALGNENLIPKFVSASSPMGLRRAMHLNNVRNGKTFTYFQIMQDRSRWIAWYYDHETDPEELNRVGREVFSGDETN